LRDSNHSARPDSEPVEGRRRVGASAGRGPRRGWLAPPVVITLTLLTFAVALYLVSLQLRRQVREQIAGRDARLFYAMTMMRQRLTEAEGATDGWLEDPRNQVALVLKVSDLLPDYDVLGIRLFNPAGRYVGSFSTNLTAAELDGPDVLELQELRTVSHFRPAYRLGENFADAPRADQTDPVL